MVTPAVRDLKRTFPDWEIKVETNYRHIWDNNPHLSDFKQADTVCNVGAGILIQGSKTSGLHFTQGVRICIETKMGIKINQGRLKPEVFLSEAEKKKEIIGKPYWLINTDCGCMESKRWYFDRWQKVVNTLDWITFVQIGLSKHNHNKLEGKNVIDFIDKTGDHTTGIRDLVILYYHAEGSIGLVSSQMHLAACFNKPCVVVAGAREPLTLEQYQNHRYLHNIGCMPCSTELACWKCSLTACEKRSGGLVNGRAKCMDMIKTTDVINAITSYYKGGALSRKYKRTKKPVLKIVSNVKYLGGAERSAIEIGNMALERGYRVEFVPRGTMSLRMKEATTQFVITNNLTGKCDVLLLYASDMVFSFGKEEFDVFKDVQAKRKVMALTYKIGRAGTAGWTKDWDLYLFLSSTMRDKLLKKVDVDTKVLAPACDLERFLSVEPDYSKTNVVRLSSQGDNKFSKDEVKLVESLPNTNFKYMPAPSFMGDYKNVEKFKYDEMPVEDFLKKGSCFSYMLPYKYTDQGPRVIVEAMASGLPVIADNRDGAKDRVTEDTGWLVDSHLEYVDVINSLTPEILEQKGKNARKRAKKEFRRERWIEAILS